MRFLKTAAAGLVMTLALGAGVAAQDTKAAPKLDVSLVKLGTTTYDWVMGGNSAGTLTAVLSKEGDQFVAKQSLESQMFSMQAEVRLRATDLVPVAVKQTMVAGENTIVTTLKQENGKITGSANLPAEAGGDKTWDLAAPDGTLLGDASMQISLMPLTVGQTLTFNVFNAQTSAIQPVAYKVAAEEKVTVPAGTFDAYKLEIGEGDQAGTTWVTKALPHQMLKRDMAAYPISLQAKTLPQ